MNFPLIFAQIREMPITGYKKIETIQAAVEKQSSWSWCQESLVQTDDKIYHVVMTPFQRLADFFLRRFFETDYCNFFNRPFEGKAVRSYENGYAKNRMLRVISWEADTTDLSLEAIKGCAKVLQEYFKNHNRGGRIALNIKDLSAQPLECKGKKISEKQANAALTFLVLIGAVAYLFQEKGWNGDNHNYLVFLPSSGPKRTVHADDYQVSSQCLLAIDVHMPKNMVQETDARVTAFSSLISKDLKVDGDEKAKKQAVEVKTRKWVAWVNRRHCQLAVARHMDPTKPTSVKAELPGIDAEDLPHLKTSGLIQNYQTDGFNGNQYKITLEVKS